MASRLATPRWNTWCRKPGSGWHAAAALCALVGDDANDARNLALACAGCNHAKGRRHDANGAGDARAYEVVSALLSARLARWRAPAAAP